MEPDYPCPKVPDGWAEERETSPAIAAGIHAVAAGDRTPERIWADPTPAEVANVCRAVAAFVERGEFPDTGGYKWGQT